MGNDLQRNWIQSFTGHPVDLPVPKPGQLVAEDIAHSLALKCRFNGHCRRLYSVGEHTLRGSCLMPTPELALAFLLHELSEVALPDVPSPVKSHTLFEEAGGGLIRWKILELEHLNAILAGLGLSCLAPVIHGPEIDWMDLAMLIWERRTVMAPCAERDWALTHPGLGDAPAALQGVAEGAFDGERGGRLWGLQDWRTVELRWLSEYRRLRAAVLR
jgi:hypothetical protein